MIALQGDTLRIEGAMTLASARRLEEAARASLPLARRIDLAAVSEVDSSAIALLFGWMRAAGRPLELCQPPAGLRALAEVYGVAGLLGLTSSQQ